MRSSGDTNMLTQQRLKSLLKYDPETGEFRWIKNYHRRKRGDVAGTEMDHGYIRIKIDQKPYRAHRLAWFYMTGEWPKDQIDHKNNIRSDNRWSNLREAANSQNVSNRKTGGNSDTGYRGVVPRASSKYKAQIRHKGRLIDLGIYDCPKEAHEAYCKAAKELYGEFARFD